MRKNCSTGVLCGRDLGKMNVLWKCGRIYFLLTKLGIDRCTEELEWRNENRPVESIREC